MKAEWLKKITCKKNEECSECHEEIKIGDVCYENKNGCLWCIECEKYEDNQ